MPNKPRSQFKKKFLTKSQKHLITSSLLELLGKGLIDQAQQHSGCKEFYSIRANINQYLYQSKIVSRR